MEKGKEKHNLYFNTNKRKIKSASISDVPLAHAK